MDGFNSSPAITPREGTRLQLTVLCCRLESSHESTNGWPGRHSEHDDTITEHC
jgi:hypothetical protein